MDGTLYTGATTDITKRIATHNKGKGAAYTRSRLPVVLKWATKTSNQSQALKLEYAIKRLSKTEKQKLIRQTGTVSTTLSFFH
jgi:putative endonuclease